MPSYHGKETHKYHWKSNSSKGHFFEIYTHSIKKFWKVWSCNYRILLHYTYQGCSSHLHAKTTLKCLNMFESISNFSPYLRLNSVKQQLNVSQEAFTAVRLRPLSFWMWRNHLQGRLCTPCLKQSGWINSSMNLLVGTWKLHYSRKCTATSWERSIYAHQRSAFTLIPLSTHTCKIRGIG